MKFDKYTLDIHVNIFVIINNQNLIMVCLRFYVFKIVNVFPLLTVQLHNECISFSSPVLCHWECLGAVCQRHAIFSFKLRNTTAHGPAGWVI